MAGPVAFSAFLSLLPLLVLVYVPVAVVGESALADRVVRATSSFLPPQGQEIVSESIQNRTDPSGESLSWAPSSTRSSTGRPTGPPSADDAPASRARGPCSGDPRAPSVVPSERDSLST